jgi:hypothetical protein
MKVFEVVEHRQKLDEVAPLLLYGAYAIGALIAGYTVVTSAEDAYQAYEYYMAGEKDGEPYEFGDLSADVGLELAEVILGLTGAGTVIKGPKVAKLTWKQFQRLWKRGEKHADEIADIKKNFPSLSRIDQIPLKDILKYGLIFSTVASTPDIVWQKLEEWRDNPNITWEEVTISIGADLAIILVTIGVLATAERAIKWTKPAFVAFWNFAKKAYQDTRITENTASSIAVVAGNLGPMQSRNMYNADGTMKNGLEFANILGGAPKPKKKKKTRKNT